MDGPRPYGRARALGQKETAALTVCEVAITPTTISFFLIIHFGATQLLFALSFIVISDFFSDFCLK